MRFTARKLIKATNPMRVSFALLVMPAILFEMTANRRQAILVKESNARFKPKLSKVPLVVSHVSMTSTVLGQSYVRSMLV